MSHFSVIGLGKFGLTASLELIHMGHTVTGIDQSEKLVEQYAGEFTQCVVCDASDERALKELNLCQSEAVLVAISSNGNYVFIQHGEGFKTHYLHLNKKRVKRGDRVTQGQVIGTVGSTGAATGPHLHYEFLVNGVHRNPRTVHKILPKAKSLPDSELALFKVAIEQPVQRLAALKMNGAITGAE